MEFSWSIIIYYMLIIKIKLFNKINLDLEKIYPKTLGKDLVTYKFIKIILGKKDRYLII